MTIAAGVHQFLLSLMVIAAIALAWCGGDLLRSGRSRLRGTLMIGAAAMLFANVLIWAGPTVAYP